jgi:ribonuclease Z
MMALTILGNNSAIPAFGRFPTAQVLQTADESFLIDCGEGTQWQLDRYRVRKSRISRIFISHLHGDHYFGLIGLLTSMSLLGRSQDLHLYGPPPLESIIRAQLDVANVALSYPFYFHPLKGEGLVAETNKVTVHCFSVEHRIPCWGFLFAEKKKPRKIDSARAAAYEIPASFYEKLQEGADYVNKKGTIIPNEEVTRAAPAAKRYAFCADTLYYEALAEKVKGVDLLYHETTYLKNSTEKAFARFHSTTEQAARIATLAGAQKLLIGHFSAKYERLDEFLSETKAVFANTELALEGTCYKI